MKIPSSLFRSLSFDRAAINEEERTIELSISSEEPCERSFGIEVLDHNEGGVDLSRMIAGAPLLWSHDKTKHLGTITEARLDGRKVRVRAKIGENADAEDRWKDIKSGVLRNASVGYVITGMKRAGKTNDGEQIYVCRWMPFEASLLTIPHDISVGVGRGHNASDLQKEIDVEGEKGQTQANDMKLKELPKRLLDKADEQGGSAQIDVSKERNEAVTAERKRVADITDLQKHFRENGLAGRKIDTSEAAACFIADGKSVRDFQDFVMRGNFPEIKPVAQASDPIIGMKQRDIERYSILRAINSVIGSTQGRKFDGLEREMSDETAKKHNRPVNGLGFYIPEDFMRHPGTMPMTDRQRTLFATGSFTAAGALVPIGAQGQSLIELYRNKMHVVAMGAQVLSGLQGTLAIPRQTGGATAAWLAEDATITASNQAVGQLTLTPHRLAAATAYTSQLLAQSSPDIENFVRNDLMTVLAVEKDRAALLGTGSAGEPLGIYNTPNLATTVDITATASITYAEAVQFETNVAAGNADLGSLGYITSVFIRGTARVTPKFANTGMPLWDGDMLGSYPARATNQLTATPSVIFGNWADMIIGDWAAQEVIVDPYSLSMANQVRIVVHQLTDVGIRHPKSFCFGVV